MLIVSATADVGGLERVILILLRTLAQRGIPVAAAFPESSRTPEVLGWFQGEGVDATSSRDVRSVYQSHGLYDMIRFGRWVHRSGATVVNLHYGGAHASFKDVLCARLAGKRCVVQVHDAIEIDERRKRWMTSLAGRLAHAVIVTTPVMRDILAHAGVPPWKLHVVPCGVPPPALRPTREEARVRLGLPVDAFVVGSLARLTPSKGMDKLIDAVGCLSDSAGTLRLVIAGEGREREGLQSLGHARLGGRFQMLGRITHPEYLYASCDVFALASRVEGFGLVFVEAALHGVPSVAMDVGGVKYAVRDGETGLLVPPDDVLALSAALERLRTDPDLRARLGGAARARASVQFTADAMVDRYIGVLCA